jgi:formylglycine-generating enzyme required for sulfatase activity
VLAPEPVWSRAGQGQVPAPVMVLDFAEHGKVAAVEVMRTPGVWEGRITGGAMQGGIVMRVHTTVGDVLYAQGSDGSVLQSLPLGNGSRRVHARSQLPSCGGAVLPEGADAKVGGGHDEGSVASNCDDGTVLDVLMKWTPRAEEEAGGPVAIRAVAEAAIAMSNHTYLASGVPTYIRGLGFSVTEPYDEDVHVLSHLQAMDDGILDEVHAERDTQGADLVALLTSTVPGVCGVAYLLGDESPAWGFSFTVWYCVSNLTFTHEVGHNQGCCHAPGDGGGCLSGGVYPYSVGHRFVSIDSAVYRTVLAYPPGIRVPRLSSPLVQYIDTPTGLDVADNARTVRETAATMANYRCSSPLPGIQLTSPPMIGPESGESVSFTASDVAAAQPGTRVMIVAVAVGDLAQSGETLSLSIGATDMGVVIGGAGGDCWIQSRTTSIPADVFNEAIGDGLSVLFGLRASDDVGTCPSSEVSLVLRYRSISEVLCAPDINRDGQVGGGDLTALLSAWGTGGQGPLTADVNHDGWVDGLDLAAILSSWGEVCGAAAPTLLSVTPGLGPTSGGTHITLSGTGLAGVTSVTVGGKLATDVVVVDSTMVRAVTPPGTLGVKELRVVTHSGVATHADGFTYINTVVPAWATLVEALPDPSVVYDPTLRAMIIATGLAWRVLDTATQIEFLLIPPGAFQRGCSPSSQQSCQGSESPVHQVTLTQPHYMGRYEVTQAQWVARMGSNPSWFQSPSAEVPAPEVPNRPVEQVSWQQVQGFLTGTGMRLPTEAEWEWAYRAGTETAFHSMPGYVNGTNDDSVAWSVAWIWSSSAGQTRPVGQLPGNGFGLHDMSGNVWEWVNDWLGSYSSAAQTNPTGPATGSFRVGRGGSWLNSPGFVRSSSRSGAPPVNVYDSRGFRVARTP